MAEADTTEQVVEISPELLAKAYEMGYRPKEEFKGDEAKWVDAKTFVERGEHVLPIVKATNARLRADLSSTNNRLLETEAALKASKESIEALERYHQDELKQKVDKARIDIKAQLVAAKKSGDVESEVNLTDELTRLNATELPAETVEKVTAKETKQVQKDYTKEPDFIAWKEDNPWFNQDSAKTAIAYDISVRLRAQGDTSSGREFMDKVSVATAKEITRLGGGRSTSKVEASKGGGNSGGNGAGKSYSDLPAEAKAACNSYERELVGPNRRYKDITEWRKSYAERYFTEV